MRPIDDAQSSAAVLHWRLGQLAEHIPPARAPGPIGSLPPDDSPHAEVARAAGEQIRQRWLPIRATLTDDAGILAHARSLGARPASPVDARARITAATAITAYRERYELPDHTPMAGDRPRTLRPDAQAAYGHAQLQTVRYLARHYQNLGPEQLHEIRAAARQDVKQEFDFDPEELHAARSRDDDARRTWRSTTGTTRPAAKADHELARTNAVTLEELADHHAAARQRTDEARNELRRSKRLIPGEVEHRRQ